jgi:hypothetical protein
LRTESVGTASALLSEIAGFRPSMRNPLDKSSVAQSLDGNRLMASLLFPAAFFSLSVVQTQ